MATIAQQIEVIPPTYREVSVQIVAKPVSIGQTGEVIEKIQTLVRNFLDPLKGGRHNKGWDLGKHIYIADIAYILISKIDGLNYIKKITLQKIINEEIKESVTGQEEGWINMEYNALPLPGKITVQIDGF